jgi:hypothetical protein
MEHEPLPDDEVLKELQRLASESPRNYENILDFVYSEVVARRGLTRVIKSNFDDTRKMSDAEIAESLED